ncbi:MAG: hypothetical protein JJ877_15385 [Thalassococcus sp.]|uniref:hypothetical protein n=1 Tax=Thalassococcus sp. TaxID=1928858 RepID=UPI001B1AF2A7|nr:hypothetical protein [Thalassococcus sp.]MBO6868424.1 hypothetical protein [Thalassococcus sp.]
MSLIRPEAQATIKRWSEALAGLALIALGLYWALAGVGWLLNALGWVVAIAGAVLGFAGIQRARFQQTGAGPGMVEIIEGRVRYFGPLSGGVVDLGDLHELRLDPSQFPAHWVLIHDGAPLEIPLNADGSDALFDAFALLPGLKTEMMLREMERKPAHPVVIWRRPSEVITPDRLH